MVCVDWLTSVHHLGLTDSTFRWAALVATALSLLLMQLASGAIRKEKGAGRRHSTFYTTYLRSRQWAAKRRQVRVRAGGRCERCRSRPGIHAHHVTYARLGKERQEDLRWLCEACHQAQHGHSISGGR